MQRRIRQARIPRRRRFKKKVYGQVSSSVRAVSSPLRRRTIAIIDCGQIRSLRFIAAARTTCPATCSYARDDKTELAFGATLSFDRSPSLLSETNYCFFFDGSIEGVSLWQRARRLIESNARNLFRTDIISKPPRASSSTSIIFSMNFFTNRVRLKSRVRLISADN